MQRETKFRVWDKKLRRMYGPFELGNMGDEIQSDIHQQNTIPLQYTGLKDKNGKEIYCSDIVKGYFDVDKVHDYIWLSLTPKEKNLGYRIFEIPDNIVDWARSNYPDDLEVIGNIYENPELLKESI